MGIPLTAGEAGRRSIDCSLVGRSHAEGPRPAELAIPDHLYVVREGRLAIFERSASGHPVIVAILDPGAIYSTLGGTHHTMEDVAIAGALPNMQIVAPCDPLECTDATKWCASQKNGRNSTRGSYVAASAAARISPTAG